MSVETTGIRFPSKWKLWPVIRGPVNEIQQKYCKIQNVFISCFQYSRRRKNWENGKILQFHWTRLAKKYLSIMLLLIYAVYLQHPYVYGVLVFEAMATFVGQVSVLSLIALFGAATTAMVKALENNNFEWCSSGEYWKLNVSGYCSSTNVGDNCEKSSDPVAVVHDIHETVDWTTWDWTSAHRNGNRAKDGAREQAASIEEECCGAVQRRPWDREIVIRRKRKRACGERWSWWRRD